MSSGSCIGTGACNEQGHGAMERDEEVRVSTSLIGSLHCFPLGTVVLCCGFFIHILYRSSGAAFLDEDM